MVWLSAHLAAVLVGSLVIMTGTDLLAHGWVAGVDGGGKWLGGFLILLLISLVTSPIGIGIRALLGRIGQRNILAAIIAGLLIGVVLIPVLHPTMYPGLSVETNPLGLLLVHGLAGVAGGLSWFGVELFQTPRHLRGTA